MIICIANVLTDDELQVIRDQLESAHFIDGKVTAGWHARLVKQNTQLPKDSPVLQEVRSRVLKAVQRHPVFQMAARPKRIHPLLISRYEAGMAYGTHTDDALMRSQNQVMRSDVSFTVFLNPPEDYQGGELVIDSSQGEQDYRLPAGSMIVYPSSTLHRVETVTAGQRLAAVSWVQSIVRDPSDREILFDLDTVRQTLFEKSGKTREFDLLSKTHANLLRKWSEC